MIRDRYQNIISILGEIELQLCEASGLAAIAEVRMRIIGQLIKIPRHQNCKLDTLVKGIKERFKTQLGKDGQKKLGDFQNLRNNLAHGDYVELMKRLGITPRPRKFNVLLNGVTIDLAGEETTEAIKSIKTNQGFQKFITITREVVALLDGIIKDLAGAV